MSGASLFRSSGAIILQAAPQLENEEELIVQLREKLGKHASQEKLIFHIRNARGKLHWAANSYLREVAFKSNPGQEDYRRRPVPASPDGPPSSSSGAPTAAPSDSDGSELSKSRSNRERENPQGGRESESGVDPHLTAIIADTAGQGPSGIRSDAEENRRETEADEGARGGLGHRISVTNTNGECPFVELGSSNVAGLEGEGKANDRKSLGSLTSIPLALTLSSTRSSKGTDGQGSAAHTAATATATETETATATAARPSSLGVQSPCLEGLERTLDLDPTNATVCMARVSPQACPAATATTGPAGNRGEGEGPPEGSASDWTYDHNDLTLRAATAAANTTVAFPLSKDIMEIIFRKLDPESVCFSAQVCRVFKEVADSDAVWSALYEQRWGSLSFPTVPHLASPEVLRNLDFAGNGESAPPSSTPMSASPPAGNLTLAASAAAGRRNAGDLSHAARLQRDPRGLSPASSRGLPGMGPSMPWPSDGGVGIGIDVGVSAGSGTGQAYDPAGPSGAGDETAAGPLAQSQPMLLPSTSPSGPLSQSVSLHLRSMVSSPEAGGGGGGLLRPRSSAGSNGGNCCCCYCSSAAAAAMLSSHLSAASEVARDLSPSPSSFLTTLDSDFPDLASPSSPPQTEVTMTDVASLSAAAEEEADRSSSPLGVSSSSQLHDVLYEEEEGDRQSFVESLERCGTESDSAAGVSALLRAESNASDNGPQRQQQQQQGLVLGRLETRDEANAGGGSGLESGNVSGNVNNSLGQGDKGGVGSIFDCSTSPPPPIPPAVAAAVSNANNLGGIRILYTDHSSGDASRGGSSSSVGGPNDGARKVDSAGHFALSYGQVSGAGRGTSTVTDLDSDTGGGSTYDAGLSNSGRGLPPTETESHTGLLPGPATTLPEANGLRGSDARATEEVMSPFGPPLDDALGASRSGLGSDGAPNIRQPGGGGIGWEAVAEGSGNGSGGAVSESSSSSSALLALRLRSNSRGGGGAARRRRRASNLGLGDGVGRAGGSAFAVSNGGSIVVGFDSGASGGFEQVATGGGDDDLASASVGQGMRLNAFVDPHNGGLDLLRLPSGRHRSGDLRNDCEAQNAARGEVQSRPSDFFVYQAVADVRLDSSLDSLALGNADHPPVRSLTRLSAKARFRRQKAIEDLLLCPMCCGPIVPIIYGFPSQMLTQMMIRRELILGGDHLIENCHVWACSACNGSFRTFPYSDLQVIEELSYQLHMQAHVGGPGFGFHHTMGHLGHTPQQQANVWFPNSDQNHHQHAPSPGLSSVPMPFLPSGYESHSGTAPPLSAIETVSTAYVAGGGGLRDPNALGDDDADDRNPRGRSNTRTGQRQEVPGVASPPAMDARDHVSILSLMRSAPPPPVSMTVAAPMPTRVSDTSASLLSSSSLSALPSTSSTTAARASVPLPSPFFSSSPPPLPSGGRGLRSLYGLSSGIRTASGDDVLWRDVEGRPLPYRPLYTYEL